jgi:hypothetical protein
VRETVFLSVCVRECVCERVYVRARMFDSVRECVCVREYLRQCACASVCEGLCVCMGACEFARAYV